MKTIILLIILTANVFSGTVYYENSNKKINMYWSKCDYVYCDGFTHKGDCKYCKKKIDKQIKQQEKIIKLLEKILIYQK